MMDDRPRTVKIRMGTDHKQHASPTIARSDERTLMLEQFNERMGPLHVKIAKNFNEQQAQWENDREFWFGPTPKPTRWQKMTLPLRRVGWRVRDAWLVLIGRREAE